MTVLPSSVLIDLLRAAGALATKRIYKRLLFVSDLPPPDVLFGRAGAARRKVLRAVTAAANAGGDLPSVTIPPYDLSRPEKLKLALIAAVAHGHLAPGDLALGLVARDPATYPDVLVVSQIGAGTDESEALTEALTWELGPPDVVEAVLSLALSVGAEGWEGHPVGALFVLGDAARVMELSRQLGLNPFYGYSERERHLLDPKVRDAVHAFATLDGAIVIRDDGVVMAAGRYLQVREPVTVPLGLGARHMAAAGISAETSATAFAISQTTGMVRIYRAGKQLLELAPSRRRI